MQNKRNTSDHWGSVTLCVPAACNVTEYMQDIMAQYTVHCVSYKHGWASGGYRHQTYMSHVIKQDLRINALSCHTAVHVSAVKTWIMKHVCSFIYACVLCVACGGISSLPARINRLFSELHALLQHCPASYSCSYTRARLQTCCSSAAGCWAAILVSSQ